ncbi:MAG TPA: hypothetical protein VF290_01120 [Pyrinomonadaceae bacterium]
MSRVSLESVKHTFEGFTGEIFSVVTKFDSESTDQLFSTAKQPLRVIIKEK